MLPTTFSEIAAQERSRSLREGAAGAGATATAARRRRGLRRRAEPAAPATDDGAVTIRLAGPHDGRVLAGLAALDGAPAAPRGDVLVAEAGGEVRAALPLAGGRPVADPFYPSEALVALLATRAGQIAAAGAAAGGSAGALAGGRLRPL